MTSNFAALGNDGEELWWLCSFSNCWEKNIGGDDQNCQEEGKSHICSVEYFNMRCMVVLNCILEG